MSSRIRISRPFVNTKTRCQRSSLPIGSFVTSQEDGHGNRTRRFLNLEGRLWEFLFSSPRDSSRPVSKSVILKLLSIPVFPAVSLVSSFNVLHLQFTRTGYPFLMTIAFTIMIVMAFIAIPILTIFLFILSVIIRRHGVYFMKAISQTHRTVKFSLYNVEAYLEPRLTLGTSFEDSLEKLICILEGKSYACREGLEATSPSTEIHGADRLLQTPDQKSEVLLPSSIHQHSNSTVLLTAERSTLYSRVQISPCSYNSDIISGYPKRAQHLSKFDNESWLLINKPETESMAQLHG